MLAYLTYMGERLLEMHRLLKTSGSLYLHCDPNASHYLKVLLDGIFGEENFRNEIVWRIGWVSGFKTQKRGWIRNHDIILYYLMSSEGAKRFNKEYIPYEEIYRRRDGSKPTGRGIPIEDTWNCSEADRLDSIMIKSFSREKVGYSTQKPQALLERIIKASSNLGDLVLDPFCGSGTTVAAAHNLGRRWLGIDISAAAIDLTDERRLQPMGIRAETVDIPSDLTSARKLAAEKPFDFEGWAVSRIPGLAPNERKIGDEGIDGRGLLLSKADDHPSRMVVAQVKGSSTFNLSHFRDFLHVIQRENVACGVYITLTKNSTAMARLEASKLGIITFGASQYPRTQIWSIEELFCKNRKWPRLPALTDPHTGDAIKPTLM